MKVDQDFIQGLINVGKTSLEMCIRTGEWYAPKLLVEYGGELHVILIAGGYEEFLAACQLLYDEHKVVTMMAYTADAYMEKKGAAQYGQGRMQTAHITGSLGPRFERGDKAVTECLHITLVTPERACSIWQPYRRGKGKGQTTVWGDPTIDEGGNGAKVEGRYVDAMRWVIERTHGNAN